MANYLWGVTSTEVLRAAGHPVPASPVLPTATACGEYIDGNAAWVNGEVRALTGGDPETLATADDVTYQLGRRIVIKLAAAEWLQGNGGDPQRARELREAAVGTPDKDGKGGQMSTLRRLMAQARDALTVQAGPATALVTSTAPVENPSWVTKDGFT